MTTQAPDGQAAPAPAGGEVRRADARGPRSQGGPLGQGGHQLAELDLAQQRAQLGGDARRGRAHAAPPVSWRLVAK